MATKNCTIEKLVAIPDYSGASNVTGMVMIGNITYCVKNKSGTSYLYKYDDCEVDDYTTETLNNCTSYGLTFSPNTKNIYIAAQGKKVFTKGVDETTALVITVNESEVKALTYYEDNKFILMANDLSTGQYLCFMVGTFSGGLFHQQENFYVYNTGYSTVKDVYYNGTNGLFIVTNDTDNLKNRILRVSMETPYGSGTYNGSSVYAVDDILQIDFSSSAYDQCTVESMVLDKYGRPVCVCNAVNANGSAGDAFFRVTNCVYEKKAQTQINGGAVKVLEVPNVKPSGLTASATEMAAMAMNGNTVYFVKNNENTKKCALIIYNNYQNDSYETYALDTSLNSDGVARGMLFYNGYVFVAFRNRIDQFVLSAGNQGNHRRTYEMNDNYIQGIARYENISGTNKPLFLVMDERKETEPNKIHFRLLDCSVGTSVVEDGDFYIEYDGNYQLGDIYYDSYQGLFIAAKDTNYASCKNCLLRVDMTYYNKRRAAGDTQIEGITLPIASVWNINLPTSIYNRCSVESLCITNSGQLFACCNVSRKSGVTTGLSKDGVVRLNNVSFQTERIGINIATDSLNSIQNYGGAKVPGTLAINGRKAYCFITNTTTNNESYLLHTGDYRNDSFELEPNLITGMAHCNGGTYHKNTLYTCDYVKTGNVQHKIGIFDLSNDYSEYLAKRKQIDTGKDIVYGAISYYKNDMFLVADYQSGDESYAKAIKIDLVKFNKDTSGNYTMEILQRPYISVENPLFNDKYVRGALQDAHYEPGIGLILGGYTQTDTNASVQERLHFVMKIDVDYYTDKGIEGAVTPTEIYNITYEGANFEPESPVITEYGELLIAANKGAAAGGDAVVKTSNLLFTIEP